MEHYEKFKETRETFDLKIEIWMLLNNVVEKEIPNAKLICFGSTVSRICLEGSDMDIVILINSKRLNQVDKITILETIEDKLSSVEFNRKESFFSEFTLLSSCAVPLLKFKSGFLTKKSRQYIEVELSVSQKCSGINDNWYQSTQDGTRNTHLMICYSKMFQKNTYPILKILGIVLKQWAKHHSLLGNFYHRLSAYGLMLMLIFYLQQELVLPCLQKEYPEKFGKEVPIFKGGRYSCEFQKDIINKWNEKSLRNAHKEDLGYLLAGFFRYYSDFDYYSYKSVISVRTGELLDKRDCAEYAHNNFSPDSAREWYREILIEDPIHRYNVARATSDISVANNIKETFSRSSSAISQRNMLIDAFTLFNNE